MGKIKKKCKLMQPRGVIECIVIYGSIITIRNCAKILTQSSYILNFRIMEDIMVKQRILGLLLVLCLFASGSSIAFAASNDSLVMSLDYTIYDKDMNVIKTGTVLSGARYTWDDDITLDNGDVAIFTPSSNSKGLYCEKGTTMSFSYSLDRSAFHRARLRAYLTGSTSEYVTERTAKALSTNYVAQSTDHYYGMITNLSSDPITITMLSITF